MGRQNRGNTIFMLTVIILIIPFTLCGRLIVRAEEWEGYVKNSTGEKDPWGDDYLYKIWNGVSWGYCGGYGTNDDDYLLNPIYITYDVTYNYKEAYKMIELVNQERRKAGVGDIQTNDTLMQIAMERAAETTIYWAHQRPDGSTIEAKSMFIRGENIHVGFSTAKDANQSLAHSSGHYENMINPDWVYAGFGCVGHYWVQIFTDDANFYQVGTSKENRNESTRIDLSKMTFTRKNNEQKLFTAAVNPNFIRMDRLSLYNAGTEEYETVYKAGDILKLGISLRDTRDGWGCVSVSADQLIINPQKNCRITNGIVTFPQSGKAQFNIALKAAPQINKTVTMNIHPLRIKPGTTVVLGSGSSGYSAYRITSAGGRREVAFEGNRASDRVTIPDKIKLKGKNYRVTAISPNAFQGNVRLTQVSIGRNMRTIGRRTFYQCKNLRTIRIRSSVIKKVGKDALKGIHAKAVIRVPKRMLPAYRKLFHKKGQGKAVQIKK